MNRLQKVMMGAAIFASIFSQIVALTFVLGNCQIDGWISFQRHLVIYPVGLLVFNSPILLLMGFVAREDKKDAARKKAAYKNKRKPK